MNKLNNLGIGNTTNISIYNGYSAGSMFESIQKSLKDISEIFEAEDKRINELLPYQVLISLGVSLINNTGAVSKMDFNWFYANVLNTKDRIMYEAGIDDVFAGKLLPVAVMKNKKYSNIVSNGLEIYENILMQEEGK